MTITELRARFAPAAIEAAGEAETGLTPFGYTRPLDPGRVYLLGELTDATDGGTGRVVLGTLAVTEERGGTPEATAAWGRAVFGLA